MVLIMILVAFALMLLLGMPIAFVLGVAGLVALFVSSGSSLLMIVPQQIFSGMDSFVLMAIPFFILAGELMNASGITDRIVRMVNALVGHFRGGLGHVNIVASIFFAGISGAAVADTAALGTMLIPAMTKSGYSKPYSTAVTAASSIIGPTIPPSIPMIVYGSVVSTSIAGLFAAGIVPGVLMGVLMMGVNHFISLKRGYQVAVKRASFSDIWQSLVEGIVAMGMPVIILGGVLGGVFTPTEAAAVAVGYAVIVGFFVLRTLDIRTLWQVLQRTVYTSGVSLLLVSMGGILSWVLASEQVPDSIARFILGVVETKCAFLFVVCIFLLIVGCFMDLTASIIILAPILSPIATQMGISPLHFAITMVVALNIGLNTPPVGAVLFVASSVAKERLENIVREIWPFLLCEAATLAAVAFWPALSMTVPRVLGLS